MRHLLVGAFVVAVLAATLDAYDQSPVDTIDVASMVQPDAAPYVIPSAVWPQTEFVRVPCKFIGSTAHHKLVVLDVQMEAGGRRLSAEAARALLSRRLLRSGKHLHPLG